MARTQMLSWLAAGALLALTAPAFAQTAEPIAVPAARIYAADSGVSEEELHGHIAYLASDALEGRFPGTAGETLTLSYIAGQLAAQGFVGGLPDGGWYQPVPLVRLTTANSRAAFVRSDGRRIAVDEVLLRGPLGPVDLHDVPLMWVGHGTNDAGDVIADVRGKVAVMLQADRDGEQALNLDARRRALVDAGALGTLVIPAGSAQFGSLRRAFTGRRMALGWRAGRGQIDGVLSLDAARALLATIALDVDRATVAASTERFVGSAMPVKADLSADTVRNAFDSYNVVARLPGAQPDSGTVMLTGHWDHLGLCRPEGTADRICNGAVDNASGIAALLSVAARLGASARAGQPLDRTVIIVATTAEEQGLLGAYHLAANPPVPLDSIAVTLNIDTIAIAGRGAPMAVVGRSSHPFIAREADRVAQSLGRAVDDDLDAESFDRRQDGWALSQSGVPSIMAGGSFSDPAKLQTFISGNYHSPADELSDATPLGGAADDADLHVALTRHFATLRTWPDVRGPDE